VDGCIGHEYAYQSVIYLTINLIIAPKDFSFPIHFNSSQ